MGHNLKRLLWGLVVTSFCSIVGAQTIAVGKGSATIDGITWNYTSTGNQITIDSASPVSDTLIVPSDLYGTPIVGIGNRAFASNTSITSVVLPSSVEAIGDSAFSGCVNLQSVTMPRVVNIGEYAFADCSNLETAPLPSTLKNLGSESFRNCQRLKSVVIPGGVKTISYAAFQNCRGIETLTISEGVTRIEKYAFAQAHIGEVELPLSVQLIREKAFYSSGITRLSLGNVEKIENDAFLYCHSLSSVLIPKTLKSWGQSVFEECRNLREVTLEEGLQTIGWDAFKNSPIAKIELPQSIVKIEEGAFQWCDFSEQTDGRIIIPKNVYAIGRRAFASFRLTSVKFEGAPPALWSKDDAEHQAFAAQYGAYPASCAKEWEYLIDVNGHWDSMVMTKYDDGDVEYPTPVGCPVSYTIENNEVTVTGLSLEFRGNYLDIPAEIEGCPVRKIESSAFDNHDGLISVTLPGTLTGYWHGAFRYCDNLTDVILSEGITDVYDFAFDGTSRLTNISLPSTLQRIGNNAFSVSGIQTLELLGGVTEIGDRAFARSLISSIRLPEGLTTIGAGAFSECHGLTAITLPSTLRTIKRDAFLGCVYLESIEIPDSVTTFEYGAFTHCRSLTHVKLPANLRIIGTNMFYDCRSLENITLPGNITSIEWSAFLGCSKLTSLTIPNGVTSIGETAFKDCISLSLISLPNNLRSIGEYAFENCQSLTTVSLPRSMTSIGAQAFNSCTGLQTISIPNSITSIGSSAFAGCTNLATVTLPSRLDALGSGAFRDCSSLTSIAFPETLSSINAQTFYGCASLISVAFSDSIIAIEASAFQNCSSLQRLTIPGRVQTIGEYAFRSCTALKEVVFNNKLDQTADYSQSIGRYAFRDCSSLESVTFSDFVTDIGEYGFSLCSQLKTLTIPSTVTSIGKRAFEGLYALEHLELPERLTSLGNDVFSHCERLTTVTLPKEVQSFGVGLFSGCTGLEDVTIPEELTSLPEYTFVSCSGLSEITLHANLSSIGAYAFSECYGLTKVNFAGSPPAAVGVNAFPYTDGTYKKPYASEWTAVLEEDGSWNNLLMLPARTLITFDANDGEGGISEEKESGEELIPPVVTRNGYTFTGWQPQVPETVPEVSETYVAQWQVNQYEIAFKANGGEGGTCVMLAYGSAMVAPVVTRVGYTFMGWDPIVPTTVPAMDATYVAQWQLNQYSFTFDAAGGEGGMSASIAFGAPLSPPVVTRKGYTFVGWLPKVPATAPAKDETYTAQWVQEENPSVPEEPGEDEPLQPMPPNWSVSNYQNNMVVYAQVKDITTGAFIETAGSLLGAFDANGVCRGVIGLLDIGFEHPVYQLTVCSDETSGEVLTLKVWDAATGEITELSDKVNFVSDTEIGLLWEPVVYEIGLKALSMTLNPGWNWCSINVAMPEGTTLSEFFTDWTPQNGDQVKAGTQTATYFNGAWRPTDFVMQPGMMYLIKNGTDAAVTTTVMGTPANVEEMIDIATGWNWVGYTGAEPIAAANAFVDNSMFANGDVLKSNAASATFYNGAWRGVLTLTPGVGYKLKVASGATIQYAQPTATASVMAAPVAMMASTEAPDWKVSNYQYNMVVYASIQNAQGVSLEAEGNLLAAFDANGVCRGVIDPLDIGIGVKVYQLTVCSDDVTESGLTLKLWDAETNTIYDVNGTIDFKSDTEIGLLWEPQVYTVVETAVKFDVAANVIGDGTVTGAGAYEAGETVTLVATPAEGYVFCGWSTTPVSMEATHSFTMPEEAVSVTAYFAPAAALNNYVAGQGLVSADEVDAKIQAHIAENNLKTPEEVEAAIEAHVASNGLLTPAQANQQTQDYIVANKLKSEQEVAAAITQAIDEYVSSNGLLTPEEAEQLVNDYIADNNLMSKDEAKQELLDADEVFTADEMKALALGAPVIQVKNGKATVSIQVKRASELDGEWEVVEDGEVSVEITPKAGEKAGFYKFVVPDEQ